MCENEFNNVVLPLPKGLSQMLYKLSDEIKNDTYEIRLRVNSPLIICGKYGVLFVSKYSQVSRLDFSSAYYITREDIKNVISALCDYCIYSHEKEIKEGFITYGNGNRVGICSDFSSDVISSITSLNIRIAKNKIISSSHILSRLGDINDISGIIIAGRPCSGKTTLLKSLAFELSSTYQFGFMKACVIDERYEMSINNGLNLDIIRGMSKPEAITHAMRAISPDIIICDEIATEIEAEAVIKCLNTGIKFIVSVHCNDETELYKRSVSRLLLDSGFFDFAVVLGSIGDGPKIINIRECSNENYSCNGNNSNIVYNSFFDRSKGKKSL